MNTEQQNEPQEDVFRRIVECLKNNTQLKPEYEHLFDVQVPSINETVLALVKTMQSTIVSEFGADSPHVPSYSNIVDFTVSQVAEAMFAKVMDELDPDWREREKQAMIEKMLNAFMSVTPSDPRSIN